MFILLCIMYCRAMGMEFVLITCLCHDVLQLHLSSELHPPGTVGHWLRDARQDHPPDHPPEQVTLPSTHRRRAGGLVSVEWRNVVYVALD